MAMIQCFDVEKKQSSGKKGETIRIQDDSVRNQRKIRNVESIFIYLFFFFSNHKIILLEKFYLIFEYS